MKILIAEDQPDQARALGALIYPWGYDSVIVQDGLTALRALRDLDGPRLALLDWGLPDLPGIEVCRMLRADPDGPYTYIVLVTGRGGQHDRVQGLEAGADDFLAKPFDPAELRARLNSGQRILNLQEQLLAAQRRLEEQATRDSLTGLWNRAAVLEILGRELARAAREHTPVGVLMADLDHFKEVNDTHGHLAGDHVLRQAAQRMHDGLRPYDTVGRYGGEEFLAVLPGCDAEVSLNLAERLRHAVADAPVELGDRPLYVTVSLGAASWTPATPADPAVLLRAADEALYRAKRAGRNRSVVAENAGAVHGSV